METDRGTEETWSDWDGGNRNMMYAAIAGGALLAGIVAFVMRRRRQAEEDSLAGMSSRAAEAALASVGDDRLMAGREFLVEKVLPEFKDPLKALLRELEAVVVQFFRRAEHAIDEL